MSNNVASEAITRKKVIKKVSKKDITGVTAAGF